MNEFQSWTTNQQANAPSGSGPGNFTDGVITADSMSPASTHSFLASA